MSVAETGGRIRFGARRRGGRMGAVVSLLPFLDIVFGMIGVFIVVFALQNIVEDGAPPSVDSIVTCVEEGRLTAYWPGGEIAGVSTSDRSFELLRSLAEDGRPFRSLILAVGPECARQAFMEGFERYLQAAVRDERRPVGLLLELYPVGGAAGAAALLEEWRGEQ